MDQDPKISRVRKMILIFLSALVALISFFLIKYYIVSNSPMGWISSSLEKKYPYRDLKLNFTTVLQELRAASPMNRVQELQFIRSKLQRVHDAHLELRPAHEEFLVSGLSLSLNANRIRLNSAYPKLPARNLIVSVDGIKIGEWISGHESLVHYSSPWARDYRAKMLLTKFPKGAGSPPKRIAVSGAQGIVEIELNWHSKPSRVDTETCVSGRTIGDSYILAIDSLWCQRSEGESRQSVFENFKRQFDQAIVGYSTEQKLILDLRGNRGGGDDEVRYVLSHFLQRRAFLYQFQYQNQDKAQTDYLEVGNAGLFAGKKFEVLVDAGCGSSCEVIASVLKHNTQAQLTGFKTHGCAGDPQTKEFGEWIYTYPSAKVWQENGSLYEGVGVKPQRLIEVEDFQKMKGDLLDYVL